MEGAGVACYGELLATVEGVSKSPSTSGVASTRLEHLSWQRQSRHEEYVVFVATQTTDAHLYTSSSNSYVVSVLVVMV